MKDTFTTSSAKETQNKAKELATKLNGGEIISMIGDLGGGKTTFTQGLAQGLKITENVASPTFVIMKKYKIKDEDLNYLYHFDLYRITDPAELIDLGFEEIISDSRSIVVIEWAERADKLIPADSKINIRFEYLDKNKRKLTIS